MPIVVLGSKINIPGSLSIITPIIICGYPSCEWVTARSQLAPNVGKTKCISIRDVLVVPCGMPCVRIYYLLRWMARARAIAVPWVLTLCVNAHSINNTYAYRTTCMHALHNTKANNLNLSTPPFTQQQQQQQQQHTAATTTPTIPQRPQPTAHLSIT